MSKDLEKTLDELGTDCRAVVSRLKAAREAEWRMANGKDRATDFWRCADGHRLVHRAGYLVAASLFAAIAFSIFFQDAAKAPRSPFSSANVYTVAYAPTEEALEAIVASQRADGSWSNDFLTQQNAAALRASGEERMRIAYRRAVRYLRTKGLAPLTDGELKARAAFAAKTLAGA